MSRLNELINELCPDGVEYKNIGELLDYEQPSKYIVKSTEYDDSYETPVLTAGQTFILGYTNEIDGIYKASAENPVIIFDDFTAAFKWVNFDFKVKSSAMKMLKSSSDDVLIRYLYHVMGFLNYSSDEHKRLWISVYSEILVPVPPLEVQREIVRILDSFTLLTAELTAELTARMQQYEFYFNKIMNMYESPVVKLGEIGQVKMCKRIMKAQTSTTGDIPFYKIGTFGKEPDAYISQELFNEYVSKYSYPSKGDILISCSGTIGRTVIFDGKPAYFQDSNIVWLEHDGTKVCNDYLKYAYMTYPWVVSTGGTISRLYNDGILKAEIPLPTLEEQKHIVELLDRFDSICNDIASGIPAEIEARQKQYEYYRDKLLTFKEKEA